MHPRPRPAPQAAAQARQRGLYALEWALIFPVFFLLLYAIVCYGLTFLVRESMQFAVEDGARAALRYPLGASAPTWELRKQATIATVQQRLDWLPAGLKPTAADIQFTVCRLDNAACNQQTPLDPGLGCDAQTPCMILVTYTLRDYPAKAIAPALDGFGLLLPRDLVTSGSILADRRMM